MIYMWIYGSFEFELNQPRFYFTQPSSLLHREKISRKDETVEVSITRTSPHPSKINLINNNESNKT